LCQKYWKHGRHDEERKENRVDDLSGRERRPHGHPRFRNSLLSGTHARGENRPWTLGSIQGVLHSIRGCNRTDVNVSRREGPVSNDNAKCQMPGRFTSLQEVGTGQLPAVHGMAWGEATPGKSKAKAKATVGNQKAARLQIERWKSSPNDYCFFPWLLRCVYPAPMLLAVRSGRRSRDVQRTVLMVDPDPGLNLQDMQTGCQSERQYQIDSVSTSELVPGQRVAWWALFSKSRSISSVPTIPYSTISRSVPLSVEMAVTKSV
jgi:hypothetical protein